MIHGIGEKRWNRLIEHLETLEKETGTPLRKPSKESIGYGTCPIQLFAPLQIIIDGDSFSYFDTTVVGEVIYLNGDGRKKFKIYTRSDSRWWCWLTKKVRIKVLRGLIDWQMERDGQKSSV